MTEKLNNRDAERQAAIRMHLLRVFAFMDAAAGDGLHFPEHELDAGEILSDLMAEVNVEPEDHEDVAQALVDECAPEIPTPAADEVRKHVASLRALATWIMENDHDMNGLRGLSEVLDPDETADLLSALQARSAEPAGEEPVAWMYDRPEDGLRYTDDHLFWPVRNHFAVERGWKETPLYATPTNPERLVEALRAIANLQRHSREDDAENAQMMEDIARRALSAAPLKEGEGE